MIIGKKVIRVFLFCLGASSFMACSSPNNNDTEPNVDFLFYDEDFQDFFNYENDLVVRLQQIDEDGLGMLVVAYQQKDYDAVALLLGYSDEDFNNLRECTGKVGAKLKNALPHSIDFPRTCNACLDMKPLIFLKENLSEHSPFITRAVAPSTGDDLARDTILCMAECLILIEFPAAYLLCVGACVALSNL